MGLKIPMNKFYVLLLSWESLVLIHSPSQVHFPVCQMTSEFPSRSEIIPLFCCASAHWDAPHVSTDFVSTLRPVISESVTLRGKDGRPLLTSVCRDYLKQQQLENTKVNML